MNKRLFQRNWIFLLACIACSAVSVLAQSDPSQYEYPGRDARQQPERIMKIIGVKEGMVIGEAGAGGGYFTVKFAKAVGPSGKVYANDINENYLEYLEKRVREDGFENVQLILGEEKDPLFPESSLDLAFMLNVYHHLDYPEEFLRNIIPSLKPGATLVIVESDKDRRSSNHRHSSDPDETLKAAESAGYELVKLDKEHSKDFIMILRPRNAFGGR